MKDKKGKFFFQKTLKRQKKTKKTKKIKKVLSVDALIMAKNKVPTRIRTYMNHECEFVGFSLRMSISTASAAGLNLHLVV
jgi:hypothetical protein